MPDETRRRRSPSAPDECSLPPDRAFVIQLRPQASPGGDLFVGRLEHIVSGEVRRFASALELLAFIEEIGGARGSRREEE